MDNLLNVRAHPGPQQCGSGACSVQSSCPLCAAAVALHHPLSYHFRCPASLYCRCGHNLQHSAWTAPDSMTEVTVNLFTLWSMEHVFHRPMLQAFAHWAKTTQDKLAAQLGAFRGMKEDGGAVDYAAFKEDPVLALRLFCGVIHRFGWDAITKAIALMNMPRESGGLPVIAYGHGAHAPRLPMESQQPIDLWLLALSTTTGHNLSAYMASWGLPISAEARAAVARFPA